MSSRRKRAPPVRVDEEKRQQLHWNMHEDRRNEPITISDDDEQPCPGSDTSSAHCIILSDSLKEEVAHRDKKKCSKVVSFSKPIEKEETVGIFSPLSLKLNIVISPYHFDNSWKAFLGELTLQLLPEQSLTENFSERSITLMSSESSNQFLIYIHSKDEDVEKQKKEPMSICDKGILVESSFSGEMLEDLGWLQKKRRIKLYHKPEGNHIIKVGIYLLEAGLAKLDFLSDANSRMKKFNQLMKKVMEKLHNYIIPDVLEEDEDDPENEPEGQDIDELYHFVKQAHQQETRSIQVDVQHPALIPVLRPYQREAVNWMLQQECFRSSPATESALHFLWREIVTSEGLKLYYNPYTGCIIREYPNSGLQLLGGILADEMGLGKTVEVLALILTHTRQDVKQDALTLPEGKVVNYFIPSHYFGGKLKETEIQNIEFEPKEKVQCPPTRVMILTAVKEMNGKKGVSILSIYKYVSSIYRYDVQRNRSLLKRMLKCLIFEGLVKQIKGHGFSGTFTLGKNYKEEDICDKTKKQAVGSPRKIQKESRKSGNKDTDSEYLPSNTSDDDDDPYYYYYKSRRNRSKLRKKPVPSTKKGKSQPFINPHSQGLCPATSNSGITDVAMSKSTCISEFNQENETEDCAESLNPAVSDIPPSNTMSPFNTSDYRFECICGELDEIDRKPRVQCLKCHLWQHAKCVNYDEKNVKIKPFYCPHCLVAMEPVSTRATLIISPSSICHQWVDEINRHVRSSSLRVLVYQGVKKDGFLQPHFLAEQDIVIITYDVLRSELNYVDIPHSNSEDGRRLRNQKRYMAIPSPLVAVEWWRICLDEAQMVECPAVKAAEMAQRLSGINRWCISGTPVQRGLEDLFGLVVFLGIEPYCVKHWWVRLLYRPYCKNNPQHLYSFIARILWRSAKKDVIDQIQIPPQTEEIHWLHFSPVERHFYHRQHEVCCQDAVVKLRKISDWALKLSSLDRRTVTSILYPLLRLRQACCHPQAVRGEFLPLQKSTMTMEELLTSLQKKCGTECEEAHRQLVCALNGLAGIHIIKGEYALAAELYREVLRSSEEHKGKLKTDSLQRLHATHNLMELLIAKQPGIPPTLRDSQLEEEAKQLREHYMSKCNTEVAEAQQALYPVQQTIHELQRKIHSNSPWWLNVIHRAIEFTIDEELVQRVLNEITSNYKQQTGKLSMSEKFRDCRGLQFLLTTQMEELNKCQKLVREAVKNLEGPPSRNVIESATVCHLRPARLPLNCCVFCKADELFTEYESKLFSNTVKGQTAIFEEMIEDEEGLVDDRAPTTTRGLWAISETERSMKAILSFAKSHRFDIEFVDEGSTSMDLFEAWKKEYKLLHEYWMALRNRVSAVDELAMATERLRVRDPREPKPNPPVLHIIEPHEVEQNRIKLLNDKAVATSQLQKKLGQLLYLTNLEKSQDKTSGGINPEPCPICARQLGKQWAVLTCGHCFCNECISIIIEQYSVGSHRSSIKCAICRQTTSHKEISYVFTSEKANQEEDIPVKGSHSTKVEAVIRTLMKIQLRDPGAKALVFSTWQDVLDIISKALTDNNMEFAQISRVKTFQENLSAFKRDPQINILLLPLHTGSNGLTIIEATHVLLVEPILNPAHELQAIGRVHRIGQTKPTIVHRFLIKATIEERMQAMLKTAERSHTNSSVKHSEASVLTVADLADLFTKETEELE
ncbi:E3 ubiquitin-protein ligase SHPRH isoform X1 [Piliocolobus tephrosceles]|uniref:E3 ubiquitin-protein ligase SHPRH n=1 Tax=Piliocolobus tephrosceles TaxID=591936 RepID=A0A8C9GC77_9PRIM|nr:E3 ubiquitin-protein ligase SHPRH isoform X1 [Piliocolobus tephrosceles]XP_023050536.1 E3 ubiquitin-protein ligase SHPRH isoform X1 [Piliocolobus tephrosceles]XP_023050537.1 E3 ubiquitin-protein ligase SHPRH isoform X1 [Piliocolobus tephrosceles]XP_023050538.1 E3 ubiquitin-protein ligase SHPRH isoform X1 [Piliocolobus tephrosceles]XP_023050539.1 E3 ubiquitin-protein ligase SHPRH isoform X1 [Piliocolobus tephrosceles]XP_023050541.1 E3 ubiquitin-protein ligase SHPRH isoform X1 [Piliocolobus t